MKKLKHKIILSFLGLCGLFQTGHSQTFGLKAISVSDSSIITKDLRTFDSLWYKCLIHYGKNDISNLFADNSPSVSKTNPITLLNFINGIDVPLCNVFEFKLVNKQVLNDSILLYQLDIGWMQFVIPFNRNKQKLLRFESINLFDLNKYQFKNLTVYSKNKINKKEFVLLFKTINQTAEELGINVDSFFAKEYVIYSGSTLKESYSYVGGLEYVNYFNKGSIFGGMGDPYNHVVLSGIQKPIHVHELLHFVIKFPCNNFIGEGLASYYGGIGSKSYTENLGQVLEIIKSKEIHNFSEINNLWMYDNAFNSLRGSYVLAAFMLSQLKKDFNNEIYRKFVRQCRTDQEMIANLKILYNVDSEKLLFDKLFYTHFK